MKSAQTIINEITKDEKEFNWNNLYKKIDKEITRECQQNLKKKRKI